MSATLARLRSAQPGLTPALERIASYAIRHPDRVIYQTVTQLADASGASEASVIRFCHDLGYEGFQDFKLSLAVDLASNRAAEPQAGPPRSTSDLIELVVDEAQSAVTDTGKLIEPEQIETAARRILAARRVDVYGVAASGIIASYFHYKLVRLGLPGSWFSDPHMASMSAVSLAGSDVAIAISSSGSTVDTVKALGRAEASGAFTIAVTNLPRSPLTAHARLVLVAANPESPLTGGAATSKLSQLLLLEVLFNVIVRLDPERSSTIHGTAEAVVGKSY